jgi:hypothetical protein
VTELSAPILQQPRLMLVLPVGIMVVAVVAANLAWFGVRAAGGPRAAGGGAAVLCVLAGIALAISSSVGSQGTVRADAAGGLEVDPEWRATRQIDLARAHVRQLIWRRGGVTMLLVGVIVEVGDGEESVTIGASDPALAAEFEGMGAETTTVPPSVTIAPADFRRLAALLPTADHANRN